jgi:hypothetical protein
MIGRPVREPRTALPTRGVLIAWPTRRLLYFS